MAIEINGTCDPQFDAVKEAFAANFASGDEVGASVCAMHRGQLVVDLWAGDADPHGNPWQRDTIVNVYSTTKTMAATCVLMLADRGQIDLFAPVATYWPEFAANGKEGITVAHVMAHTAGLCAVDNPGPMPEYLYDWDKVTADLAAQAPLWDDRGQPGYHAVTQGYLQGELVRRVDGRDIDRFFREEVSGPLGADFHISLDAEHDDRVGELIPPTNLLDGSITAGDPTEVAIKTGATSPLDATEPQTRAWRQAVIPAAGGFGNARSVARVHAALANGGSLDGVDLMSDSTVRQILEPQARGLDLVLGQELVYGMGFGLASATMPLPPSAFYWGGWGGSVAIVDVDAEFNVAYVMNRMADDMLSDLRGANVALAAFGSLAES